jgi:phosphatidylserine/phosphatidylglycerophosphate/cardiolipin synthase-like enzyme
VLALYRQFVSPTVQREDLFAGGVYRPRNAFNTGTTRGAMHLVQGANTLTAEIELAAAATIRRKRDDRELSGAQELIACSRYGDAGRNSDPHIGEQVNALARRKADITLNNPVGLYFHEFNPVGWITPDGADPREFWKFVRGTPGYFVRAVFEVPAGRGYVVSDIRLAGRPIDFGAQIADFITIKLEGLATRIGQSTAAPFNGCRGQVPSAAVGAAAPAAELAMAAPLPGRREKDDDASAAPPSPSARAFATDAAMLARLPSALREEIGSSAPEAAPPALLPYPHLEESAFVPRRVSGKITAYASPDSTYAVTKKLIERARRSIVVAIYDLSASYMKDALKRAMQRGVTLSLMLDTNSEAERDLLEELAELGATCVKSPSTSAGNPIAYFGNAHQKIVVVDGEVVMIQSGNWSENSIPFNEGDGEVVSHFAAGNRDMGLAVHSRALARFFAELVARDMRLAQGQPPAGAPPAIVAAPAEALFFEAAPPDVPEQLFPSFTLTPSTPVSITPVVSPENFHATLKGLLRSAKHSLRIQQQYIRGGQPAVEALLDEIAAARAENPTLAIKVIVSLKFLTSDQKANFEQAMQRIGLQFDDNYRYLSLRHFVHCHNKLIVVDDAQVLLGSQNWSTSGLLTNRETSLLVEDSAIATYFAGIFDSDWDTSEPRTQPPEVADALGGLRSARDFAQGGIVVSDMGDYVDL